jgi:diacylglycerol kinase (ATP)
MPAKVILNPFANRWKALQRRGDVESALNAAGVPYDLVVTSAPGHGLELARNAVLDGFTPVIAAGGDGSVSEVVNGMAQANPDIQVPLGILPLGSANDLAYNLGLPQEITYAAQVIAGGHVRRIDLCKVAWNGPGGSGSRYFDNNSAIGLEPYITLKQERIHWLKGIFRYLLATLQGIGDNPYWRMRLTWEGGGYKGNVTLVTVGNAPRTGGLFYMAPHADPFDGRLTFVYGWINGRVSILRVLPMTMKPGRGSYVEHPSIHEIHSSWLKVQVERGTPLHADGEIQSLNAEDIEYSVHPGCLPVLAVVDE